MVTIYTLPSCVQCESTKRVFSKNGIEYTEVDLNNSEEGMETVKRLGYTAAPVVVAGEKHWSGFRLEMIKSLAA